MHFRTEKAYVRGLAGGAFGGRLLEFISSNLLNHVLLCLGFYWRQFMTYTGAEPEAWNNLAVVVPIVVFFGPFGSFLSSHFHRQVLAMFIYVLDTLALVIATFNF